MTLSNKLIYTFLTISILLLSILCQNFNAYADSSNYTFVLDDLCIDKNFDFDDYPIISADYSINVIQIAESSDNELFIYTYQPCGGLQASSINLSLTSGDDTFFKNYKLNFINSYKTLFKYKVEDLIVRDDLQRYYSISSIFRPYDETLDFGKEIINDNTIDEIAFEVGKQWMIESSDEKIIYTSTSTETIEITDKYVGFVRYSNGFSLMPTSCDSHYIAFSTDKPIDKLLEADVYYVSRTFETPYYFGLEKTTTYGTPTEEYKRLSYKQMASNPADGLFGHKYTWDRIQTISEFTEDLELSEDVLQGLQGKQWVLRFAETEFKNVIQSAGFWTFDRGTEISEVTILRLKFETKGITYNLGVIDNKQSGNNLPGNTDNIFNQIIKSLLGIIGVVLMIVVVYLIVKLIIYACKKNK